jgi:predicted TIM-barrel fold metal-dependent hydrolase
MPDAVSQPAEPIVDAHHHIWRFNRTPWLQGPPVPRIFGEYSALRRDYLMTDFLSDCTAAGVVQSVYVQVNVAPGDEIEEVQWVSSVASQHGLPNAITAFADLASLQVASTLDAQLAVPGVRAIRQQLHWHVNAQYRFASRADLFDDPIWRRGLAEVARRNLAFELQVFPAQMRGAIELVRSFPELQFVLIHAGMLEDRSPAGWQQWREVMVDLARLPNVVVKLSGLGTFLRACHEQGWRDVIVQTVECFGPQRCMFGSNFPIERLWTSYGELVRVFKRCIDGYSAAERTALLSGTARRVYAL